MLDIFGFESFPVNRFEQLCINYANERLQEKFCRDLFRSVQAEYEAENVPWSPIDFPDAQAALKLIEGSMGVVDVLDEECARPGAISASRRVEAPSRHRRDSSLRPFGPNRVAPRRWFRARARVEAEDLAR